MDIWKKICRPNVLSPKRPRAQYLENSWRCYLAAIANYKTVCCDAVRSAILAIAWLLVSSFTVINAIINDVEIVIGRLIIHKQLNALTSRKQFEIILQWTITRNRMWTVDGRRVVDLRSLQVHANNGWRHGVVCQWWMVLLLLLLNKSECQAFITLVIITVQQLTPLNNSLCNTASHCSQGHVIDCLRWRAPENYYRWEYGHT